MPTVGKEIADKIKAGDGYYEDSDDPRVMRIVEYTNQWGGTSYGLEYDGWVGTYAESPFVINPRVYFEAED